MAFWNFWKSKNREISNLRIIKTIRGQKKIDKAITQGINLIIKNVEPFSTVVGKYCIVKNKKSGMKFKIYDFRDERGYSEDYEVVQDWTYEYKKHEFPNVAAYVIPEGIKNEEIVLVEDLIENFLSYQHNQGGSKRLKSCKAIWKNNDFEIQYNPDVDCINVVG
ncbi:MAG: hypothetical protein EBX50_22975 [Chitinophagia bacterium]|nr:hypothetical protein [Chitinophagia bacterium]